MHLLERQFPRGRNRVRIIGCGPAAGEQLALLRAKQGEIFRQSFLCGVAIRRGLFQRQRQIAQSLGQCVGLGRRAFVGAAAKEVEGLWPAKGFHEQSRGCALPMRTARSDEHMSQAGLRHIPPHGFKVRGIVKNEQPIFALIEAALHRGNRSVLLGRVFLRQVEGVREGGVITGQGVRLFRAQPPHEIVVFSKAIGILDRELGFAHAAETVQRLRERGSLALRKRLAQAVQQLHAAGEIGIAQMREIPNRG